MDDSNSNCSDEEDDSDEESSLSASDDSTMFDVLPVEHHGCFAHVLQLVVKDGFRSASQIERIINKCSKIVAHVRRSTIAKECPEGEKTLKLANATRWNSQLKMIRSILAIPSIKLDFS